MSSPHDPHRRRDVQTEPVSTTLGHVLKVVFRSLGRLPLHLRGAVRDRLRALQASRAHRVLARLVLVAWATVAVVAWDQALDHGRAKPVDPKLSISVSGAPLAVVPFAGNVVVASASGRISAYDPLTDRDIADRQLSHAVDAVTAGGGWLFAIGGGRVTRLGPNLQVSMERPVAYDGDLLASTTADLWAAGHDGTLARIDPATLTVTSRTALGGPAGGLAVSPHSVWVTVPARAVLLVVHRHGGRLTARALPARAGAGPVVLASGYAWVLSPAVHRLDGYDATDPRRRQTVAVTPGADLLATGNSSLWVSSSTTSTVSQYGVEALRRVGGAISVGGLPSAMTVDVHAVWVASSQDHTLQRLDLIGLALARERTTHWETLWAVNPSVYAVVATALTILFLQFGLMWRFGNPDAGLPLQRARDISLLARDMTYYTPLSLGEPVETVVSTQRRLSLQVGNGSFVGIGGESGETHTLRDPPCDHGVGQAIQAARNAKRVQRFVGYAPKAGVWLLRAPRHVRVSVCRLQPRFESLAPFAICQLSGKWIVSYPSEDILSLQLPQLIDRAWFRWRPVPIAEQAWLTVVCPTSALTPLGRSELEQNPGTITMNVLAVPCKGLGTDVLQMRLVVAYY